MAQKYDLSKTANTSTVSNQTTSYADSGNVTESHVLTLSNVGNSPTTVISGLPAIDQSSPLASLLPNISGSGTGTLTSAGGPTSKQLLLGGGALVALIAFVILFRKKT